MASRLFLVLLLLTLPVATVALPADALWIPGLYDGSDYDDCLAVSASSGAGVTPPAHVGLVPPGPTDEGVVLVSDGGPSSRLVPAAGPRSPPLA